MEPVIIIPARRASTRLADKMLLDIKGKPLIRWTVEAALQTGFRVIVATDDKEIARRVDLECDAVITGPCFNGTERCIEAAQRFFGVLDRHMIINWQGDSPMTRPQWVRQLAASMAASPCGVGTLEQHVDRLAHAGEVEVVHGYNEHMAGSFGRALPGKHLHYRHVGIYAIKPEAFQFYGKAPSAREIGSGLEQLRWIERGVAVATCKVSDEEAFEINHDLDVGLFKTWLESQDEIV